MIKQRVITALILAPLMIIGIFFLPLHFFAVFIAVIAAVGAWEWANMAGYSAQGQRIGYAAVVLLCLLTSPMIPDFLIYYLGLGGLWWLLAFVLVKSYPGGTTVWKSAWIRAVLGLLVLIPMWGGFVYLKQVTHSSLLILLVMLIIWGADTGAYFAGKKWGKAKLAPNVSPGKSWAGFWGGMATSLAVGVIFGLCIDLWVHPLAILEQVQLLMVVALTTVVSVLGDLLESMMKRYRGIKDSSALLPGHGGVLDRIDSMAAAVPVFALCVYWMNWEWMS